MPERRPYRLTRYGKRRVPRFVRTDACDPAGLLELIQPEEIRLEFLEDVIHGVQMIEFSLDRRVLLENGEVLESVSGTSKKSVLSMLSMSFMPSLPETKTVF